MKEFLATLLALSLIIASFIPVLFALSYISEYLESPLVYFVAGFFVGVYRKRFGRSICQYSEKMWQFSQRIFRI